MKKINPLTTENLPAHPSKYSTKNANKLPVSLAELAYISVQNIYDTADSSRQIKYKFGKRLAGV